MATKESDAKALARAVAERYMWPIENTRKVLNSVWRRLADQLKRDGIVRVPGFGIFEVKTRAERVIRDPQGRPLVLPEQKEIRFRPSKVLTLRVTGRRPS